MKLRIIRVGLALAGNALGLWIAALLLDGMDISGAAFVIAVLLFTVLAALLEPALSLAAEKTVEVLQGATTLIATALALLLTAWISDGLSIDGIGTWILATVIVWLATATIGVALAKIVLGRVGKD
jgi:putative membrane protein